MNDRDLIGIGGKYTPAEAKGEKYIFLFRVLAPSNWGEEEILEVESEAGMAGVNRAQLENSGGGVQILKFFFFYYPIYAHNIYFLPLNVLLTTLHHQSLEVILVVAPKFGNLLFMSFMDCLKHSETFCEASLSIPYNEAIST